MNDKIIYFPGLNGLRAIAAIAVVISHITLSLKDFGLDPFIFGAFADGQPKGLYLAGYGVTVFFVLSGFLITYLLQSEKDIQEINVKKFYIRRILRIWPLYYLYLTLAIISIIVFGFDLNIKSLFFYVFYAANIPFILGTSLQFVGHYWSLGVEEQFYLFWPWINKKIGSLIPVIGVLIVCMIGIKVVVHFYCPKSLLETIIHVTRFHCMMIGGLGALLFKNRNVLFFKLIDNKLTQLICWAIMFLVTINKFHFASFIDNEIISFVSLFLIIGQINVKNRIVNLEINILDFFGKISYGIYVIHPLLIFFFSKKLNQLSIGLPYKYFIIYFIIIGATILIAYLSYIYIEKFFLKYKNRYIVVKSSSSKKI
jgi:peptidoglycan/LPS O-acetylase OafA/YrhL